MNVHVFSKDTDHFTASGFRRIQRGIRFREELRRILPIRRFKIAAPIEVPTSIRKFPQMTGRHNYAKRSQAFP
jgi:hypothetical protein